MQDDHLGAWGLGIAMALLSLLGLALASAATDRIFRETTTASTSGRASDGSGMPTVCTVRSPFFVSVFARSEAPV